MTTQNATVERHMSEQPNNHMTSWHILMAGLLLTLLSFTGTPVYANTPNQVVQQNQQNQNQNQNQSQQDIKEKPDTLIGYATEQVEQKLEGGLELEVNLPTRNLQANTALVSEYNQAFYKVETLNAGLPPLNPPANLQTPLATLEFFSTAVMQKRFGLAGYALNLNGYPQNEQAQKAPELAKKLDYLLSEKGLYLFDDLPDRPDGLIEPPVGSSNPIMGVPRRSLKLGYINYQERKVPIFIERVHVDDNAPVWVFSRQTVLNIETLYDMHKPAEFERYLPDWLTKKFFGISVWGALTLLIFMLTTLLLGYWISQMVEKFVSKFADKHSKEDEQLSKRSKGLADLFAKLTTPLTIVISFGSMFALVSGALPTFDAIASSTRPIIWMGLVFSILWLGIRILNFFANRYQDFQIESLDDEEFNKERKRRTYLSIFRRIFIFVMILGGCWVSLAEFADLEGLGKTLLTSAGIAGAVIGIAAQSTLGNIIAGFQVAITQPVRIGDTVMVDGVWCEVEDLRYTYAVFKTWDQRRMIVPMKDLITEKIENWSHTNISQSSAVYLYIDYGANIDDIRQKFIELVKDHELYYDDEDPAVLVTSVSEDTIQMRCKVSSDSPQNAWQLECDIREKMLEYIQKEHGDYLPTERITLAPRS